MTQHFHFLLLYFWVFTSALVFAQTKTDKDDHVNGYDPLLYNGKTYVFFVPPGTGGSQFLFEKFDSQGAIQIRNTFFTDIALNYDVYNQQVILKYKDAIHSTCQIEISLAWLETFDLHGAHFEYYPELDSSQRIYQVLGHGGKKIMYYCHKELLIDTRFASRNHYFSDVGKDMYIKNDNKLIRYKNNKGFVAAFNESSQSAIKKYLRKNKIKVKKAKDYIMTELIDYCNTLSEL